MVLVRVASNLFLVLVVLVEALESVMVATVCNTLSTDLLHTGLLVAAVVVVVLRVVDLFRVKVMDKAILVMVVDPLVALLLLLTLTHKEEYYSGTFCKS